MADTNEEQLLNDLLSAIAREDAQLEAGHLESRVMAAVDASPTVRLKADTTYLPKAAAILLAALGPVMFWMTPQPTDTKARVKADITDGVIADIEAPVVTRPSFPTRPTRLTTPTRPGPHTRPTRPTNPTNPTNPMNPTNPTEFVPLMPMTEQELTGSFQLVRVQMPRASLGALRSPLEHPNELVEADVLLGEDGMARAIRVSTNGSVYPWRSR